ncbi:MAG: DegT/DnrJ/EryC1/StrS family aminotransferase [Nitrospiraceae bacterium]|nr:DegT/DnrJ/EryC1/StrS family aminotransferase [Nitrospiraceae bacterium]
MTMPIIKPTLPALEDIFSMMRTGWESGVVTVGPMVRSLEEAACRETGARYAVALSSCTAGLMLVPQALKLRPGMEVIVPSFTFAATAQALLWNRLVPVFCDCLPGTCTLDPADVERNITAQTAAICGVTVYGLPPDIDALLEIGRRTNIPVYFDSAQGLGSVYKGQPLGAFGSCEVFSLSPTKVVTGIEAGLLTTNDPAIADRVRSMRDYGKDPEKGEDMVHLGLSARISEMHAAVALVGLQHVHELVKARAERIAVYRERLGNLPGCHVQQFPYDRLTSGNYFVLFIGEGARLTRDDVYEALKKSGIQTKRYFYPPLHQQSIFQHYPMRLSSQLAQSEKASREGLALPLYSHMTTEDMELVCSEIHRLLAYHMPETQAV